MFAKKAFLLVASLLIALPALARDSAPPRVTVVDEPFVSSVLRDNRIGLDPERAIKVLLPPGYAKSKQRYPVVYFLHHAWYGPKRTIEDGRAQQLIERAFADGVVQEFIFVVADYTGPTTRSLYENSPVSGRWIDYTVDEVVPLIDAKYRTLARRDSRAVVGDFFGRVQPGPHDGDAEVLLVGRDAGGVGAGVAVDARPGDGLGKVRHDAGACDFQPGVQQEVGGSSHRA